MDRVRVSEVREPNGFMRIKLIVRPPKNANIKTKHDRRHDPKPKHDIKSQSFKHYAMKWQLLKWPKLIKTGSLSGSLVIDTTSPSSTMAVCLNTKWASLGRRHGADRQRSLNAWHSSGDYDPMNCTLFSDKQEQEISRTNLWAVHDCYS